MKTDFVTMTTILKIYFGRYLKKEVRRVCNVGLQMKMILKGSEVELVNFMKTEPSHDDDLKFYLLNHQSCWHMTAEPCYTMYKKSLIPKINESDDEFHQINKLQ